MSETKHTPGPWKTSKGYPRDIRAGGEDGELLATAYPVTSEENNNVEVREGGLLRRRIYPIAEANASLFSAAPDLLAALLAALKDCQERQYNPFEPDNQSALYVRCAAIIAKAEGRQ